MSEQTTLKIESRNGVGTGMSRAVRRQGLVPGIVYGGDKEPELVQVADLAVKRVMHVPGFSAKVFDIELNGKNQKALVRDIQLHPVTDRPIHIDFMRVNAKTSVHVHVPLHFIEENCPGLKSGGVLNQVIHDLEIVAPADSIPDHIDVKLEGMQIGDSYHTVDLPLPKGVKVAHLDRDITVATIVAPTLRTEEETTPAEADAAASAEAEDKK